MGLIWERRVWARARAGGHDEFEGGTGLGGFGVGVGGQMEVGIGFDDGFCDKAV